jgi:hypothetical protein
MDKIQKRALVNSLATTVYIILVAGFMYYGSTIKLGRVNTFLAPVALLSLFVTSASITGYLIFGKPVQMYIDGKKKDALKLVTYTLGFFSATTIVALVILVLFTR